MLTAQDPPVNLTIYGDGRVLVRRIVDGNIPRGQSTHRITLGRLDPTTLFSLDPSVTIVDAVYFAATDQRSALDAAIGRTLPFVTATNDTLLVTVLDTDPELYRLPNGKVVFGAPGRPLFLDSMVQVDQAIELKVRSEASRRSLHLGYFTSGAQWQASYQVVMGRRTALVTGNAIIFSERVRVDSAEIRVLSGWVSRLPRHEWLEPRGATQSFNDQITTGAAGAVLAPQTIGHTRLYTLPGRYQLRPGAATIAELFPAVETEYERDLSIAAPLLNGGRIQNPNENQLPVDVSYVLKRSRGNRFGEHPVPAGAVRLYLQGADNVPVLVGEGRVDHTPAGQDIRISAGNAFELEARRAQVSSNQVNPTTTFISFQVTLRNASDSAVVISVQENRAANLTITESSVPVEPFTPIRDRMRVQVPARGEAILTYTVRLTNP